MRKILALTISLMGFVSCANSPIKENITKKDVSKEVSKIVTPEVKETLIKPEKKHLQQLGLINTLLTTQHFNKMPFDDSVSKKVMKRYIDYIDFGKYIFTKGEVEVFKTYETNLDDDARNDNLSMPFKIYNSYVQKMQKRIQWIISYLDNTTFDKSKSGKIETDVKKIKWVKTEKELDKRWVKRIHNELVNLIISGKEEKKATKTIRKRYVNLGKKIKKTTSEDVFQIYANALTAIYDPHTSYFSPRTGEDFAINMKLSLDGIGARLSQEEELVVIKDLIAGGPAEKSNLLGENDKILGVAQGKKGEMVDIVGWTLGDSVNLIRGKRGSIVRLLIKKNITDNITEISLVRDKINLEDSAAKSEIKTIKRDGKDYKIGVIDLPSFYIDFAAAAKGTKDYRSTTRDVKKLIVELKKKGIDGLVIDLRNNGGGSLEEAIDLTGIFIKDGPVVQVKNTNGSIKVHKDRNQEITYSGPLAVLINNNSASASEIFTGAIKDYKRGLILGTPTFGKGTVQTVASLSGFLPMVKDKIGQLKLTIAMFYRINGSSTQIKGVAPDIFIPNKKSFVPGGEIKEDFALGWERINSASYEETNFITSELVNSLQTKYKTRNKDNKVLENILNIKKWQKEVMDNTVITINLAERKKEQNDFKEKGLIFKNIYRKLYDFPLVTKEYFKKEEKDKTKAEKDEQKKYKIDAILDIANEVVVDLIKSAK